MKQHSTPVTDGAALRVARYRRGLDIRGVVELLMNVHEVTVSAAHLRSIERGDRNAGPRLLFALAQVYRADVDDFLVP